MPIRLGQEFHGHAGQIERGLAGSDNPSRVWPRSLSAAPQSAPGSTPTPSSPARSASCSQRSSTRHPGNPEPLPGAEQPGRRGFASGALKTIAVSLLKIANDIRWMGSGPAPGSAKSKCHPVQGSSIMPGKANPVIAEAVCQVAAQVIGNDATITVAGQHGNFEITVMMPVAAYTLLESIELLTGAATFADQCISGITATDAGPASVERGLMMATALPPRIGYDAAAAIAREARETGRTIREVARDRTDLTENDLTHLLDARRLTGTSTCGRGDVSTTDHPRSSIPSTSPPKRPPYDWRSVSPSCVPVGVRVAALPAVLQPTSRPVHTVGACVSPPQPSDFATSRLEFLMRSCGLILGCLGLVLPSRMRSIRRSIAVEPISTPNWSTVVSEIRGCRARSMSS